MMHLQPIENKDITGKPSESSKGEVQYLPLLDLNEKEGEFKENWGHSYRFSWTPHSSAQVTFQLLPPLERGVTLEDPTSFNYLFVADKPPQIKILSPEEKTILAASDGTLRFQFGVEDDHGIGDIWYEVTPPGEKALRKEVDDPLPFVSPHYKGTFSLDLHPYELQPYDTLQVQLFARDNRIPKNDESLGKSDVYTIRIESVEDQYDRLIEDQYQLFEELIKSLGHYLEAPIAERTLEKNGRYRQMLKPKEIPSPEVIEQAYKAHENQSIVTMLLDGILQNLENSALTEPHLKEVYHQWSRRFVKLEEEGEDAFEEAKKSRKYSALAAYMSDMEELLEHLILQLDAEIISQRMQSAERLKEALSETKERLRATLTRYKASEDPELKKEIFKEIERLKAQLSDLLQRLSDQVQRAQEEHVNQESFQFQESAEQTDALKSQLVALEKMLKQGQIDNAIAALESMGEALDALTKSIGEDAAATETEEERRYKKELSALMDSIEDLTQREAALNKETKDAVERAAAQRTPGDIHKQINTLKEERLRAALKKSARIRKKIEQLRRETLAGEKFTGANAHLRRLDLRDARIRRLVDRRFASKKSGLPLRREEREVANDLLEPLDDARSELFKMRLFQRGETDVVSRDQRTKGTRELNELESEISEMLEELYEELPEMVSKKSYDNQEIRELAKKQSKLQNELNALEQQLEQMKDVAPTLGEKLQPDIEGARDAMGKASDSIANGKAPQGVDYQNESLRSLAQLKEQLRRANQSRYKEGGGGAQRRNEKVKLEGDRFDPSFRERVLKGMRGPRPKEYEPLIDKYFKMLVE